MSKGKRQVVEKPKPTPFLEFVWAFLAIFGGVFALASLFHSDMGGIGLLVGTSLRWVLGGLAFLIPLAVVTGSIWYLLKRPFEPLRLWGVGCLAVVGSIALDLRAPQELAGGVVGMALAKILVLPFGRTGLWLVLTGLALLGLVLVGQWTLVHWVKIILVQGGVLLWKGLRSAVQWVWRSLILPPVPKAKTVAKPVGKPKPKAEPKKEESRPQVVVETAIPRAQLVLPVSFGESLPPLSLLGDVPPAPKGEEPDQSELLQETLANFGVEARVVRVVRGPAVTRYELAPGTGVKVRQIESLADDIALALAALDVRIEAPIPGKAAVGIEVPNLVPRIVHLREVLETREYQKKRGPLSLGMGKDITGDPIFTELNKMIHLLIAGATGAGKSVCLNTIISSILLNASPDQVRFLMIDPKRVELSLYDGIPHLVSPVVTDPRAAAKVLRWVVGEMEQRYHLFETTGCKSMDGYNQKSAEVGRTPLPYIVVIVDELADLMMVAAGEVEDAICRLAQKARAAGIHLILATQRPSADVITGLIKANIPSRIAFAVASGTDSSIILDMRGAERLLGKGDMLFFPVGAAKPQRVQGAWIPDAEAEAIANWWKSKGNPQYEEGVLEAASSAESEMDEEDDLLYEAAKFVVEQGRASATLLQRKFRVGYSRASRIVDMLESRGVVGGFQGSKPREILVDLDQLDEIFSDN